MKLLWRLGAIGLVVLGAALLIKRGETPLPAVATPSSPVSSPVGAVAAVSTKATPKSDAHAVVATVLDGDTIRLTDGRVVRLIGIDAPESPKGSAGTECYAEEATAAARTLLVGERVRLEPDASNTDRYGRLLRYAYIGDSLINERLVREGYARARAYPPDTRYAATLRDAQADAKSARRGLWGSTCAPSAQVPPDDKDCSDFPTRATAQTFFRAHGGPQQDPHNLDFDRDGNACESLP